MTADWPDDNPSAHRATAIYTQRVPLARGGMSFGSATTRMLTPNSSQQVITTVPTDQPAFQAILSAQLPVASLGTPFAGLLFSWFDSLTNDLIATRKYMIGAGNGVPNVGNLIGVSRGNILNLSVVNFHATQVLTYDWSMQGVSHVPNDDDWYQDLAQTVSGFTAPGNDPPTGVLCVVAASVLASSSISRLLPASSRLCRICIDNEGQPNPCDVQIGDPAPTLPLYGSTAGATFYRSGSIAAGNVVNDEFQMPNGPALLTITNLSAGGPTAPKVTITVKQFA